MMKILWFSNSPCGSIRRNNKKALSGGWLISLEEELKKCNDIELNVAYFSDIKERDFLYEDVHYYPIYLPKSSNPVKRILDRRVSFKKKDEELLPVMLDVVKRSNPDLIHIHGTEERFGLIADYVKDIPIVFSIQGLIAPYTEKYFSGMPYSEIEKYESKYDVIRNVSFKNEYKSFCYRAEREIGYLRKAKYIFGRTFWDKDVTLALNPERKYFVVNEMLRTPFHTKQWNRSSFDSRKITLVSTISSGIYKGFETVLRTAFILKTYSCIDFEWVIAGYNEKSKWVKIASKITGLNHHELNIRLLGRVDAETLSQLLVDSDIYCHVSHIENSPNSVCEAMLVGMPVIATYAGGTASLLEHEKDGILVQDGDPYVFAGAIVELKNNFEMAKRLAEQGRARALQRHNGDNIIKELLDAYSDILPDSKS